VAAIVRVGGMQEGMEWKNGFNFVEELLVSLLVVASQHLR